MKKIFFIPLFLIFSVMALEAQSNAVKRQKFIESAKSYLGTPYVYGGSSRSGIDCSGFIMCAYRDAGLGTLPHSSKSLYSRCVKINTSEREAGDLVFFADSNGISHVAIFIGSNQIIHAISDGPKTGVVISSLSENYWTNHYYASGRLIGSANGAAVTTTTTPSTNTNTSSSSSNSAQRRKRKPPTYFAFDASILADFDFLTTDPQHFNFHMNGMTLQTDLLFTMFGIKPGLMVRYSYLHPQNNPQFTLDMLFSDFRLPVCLEVFFGDYFGIYTGIVLAPQLKANEPVLYCYDGSTKQLQTPLYPGIFGITGKTPEIQLGNLGFSLVGDISFTTYMPAEGESVTFMEWFSAGLSFSAGIRMRLPF